MKLRSKLRRVLKELVLGVGVFVGAKGRLRLVKIINQNANLYIPRELGVSGFFQALENAGAQHVVLRWFEELPKVDKGHDLDILVSDAAIASVHELLTEWPDGQAIDYYSETGIEGTGYKPHKIENIPAFPPARAAEMLASAQVQPGGWAIPDRRHHFLGLAYHAVYLKGYESGLPPDADTPPRKKGSRDYATVLTALSERAGFALEQPVTLTSLHHFLRKEGWTPERAHLDALAPANPWIKDGL